jgi:alpha-tubulin suppressor-like RCC1 family protein
MKTTSFVLLQVFVLVLLLLFFIEAAHSLFHIVGAQHSLAGSLDGTLWAWGNGCDGRLGTGRQMISGTPSRVSYFDECGGFIRCGAKQQMHHAFVHAACSINFI